MAKILTCICGNMKTIFKYVVVGLIGFGLGCSYVYTRFVPNLKSQIAVQGDTISDLRKIIRFRDIAKNENKTEIKYVEKQGKADSDVELADKENIKVRINNNNYQLPNNITENSKFENGKLVIGRENITTIDLTNTVNELAKEKAKQYSRIGKSDFGCIYNRKESDIYAGIRYNAKAWDAGYYHDVNGSDWLIGVHYKF